MDNKQKIIIAAIGSLLLALFIYGVIFAFKRDGYVSEWSEWSQCSKPCNAGTQTRTRTYIPPKFGGSHVVGQRFFKESRICNDTPCPVPSNVINTSIIKPNSMYYADLSYATPKTILESENKLHRLILIPNYIYIESKFSNNKWNPRIGWSELGGRITKIYMNRNGNLEMLNNNDKIIWQSNTMDNPEAYAQLTNEGEFVIKNINNQIIKTILNKFSNKILSSDKFDNEAIYYMLISPNGQHFLIILLTQGLINVGYITNPQSELSSNGTIDGRKIQPRPSFIPNHQSIIPSNLIMTMDGNLELRAVDTNKIIWESKTSNNIGAYAELNDDGSFVIKNKNDQVIKTIINPV